MYLVKLLLLDPGEGAEPDLAHAIGGALEALLGVGAVLGRRHKLSHDLVQLFDLKTHNEKKLIIMKQVHTLDSPIQGWS